MILNEDQMKFLKVRESSYMPTEMLLLGLPCYVYLYELTGEIYYLTQYDPDGERSLVHAKAWCIFRIMEDKDIMQIFIPEDHLKVGEGSILIAIDIIELQIKLDE